MPSEPASNAGIVTDKSGERHIPESVRADGSTRKAIRVKPGYRPPEDVEVYKNRAAKSFAERKERMGIPGAAGLQDEKKSAASDKNAKRREARKKAKAEGGGDSQNAEVKKEEEQVDPEVEKEKKARNLKKKLRQAKELQDKKEGGEALLPEQIAKVIKINELIRELESLGFDSEGQPKEGKQEAKDDKD